VHGVEALVEALELGSARDAAACLCASVTLDDPREGRIEGRDAVQGWVDRAHAWLRGLSARSTPVRLTGEGRHAVLERLFHIRVDGEKRQLPMAIAVDLDDAGLLAAVRVYHSFWSLERAHRVRGRLLPPRDGVQPRSPFDAYQRALADGDVEGVLACYARDATVREPAGEPFLHRGLRGLRRLYGTMLLNGGVPLEHARAVDDGVACALEYTVVRWGSTELPPQAGVAVYERNAEGLIRATRIYDDVDPPRD
jgi:SnoaL-like protein